MSIERRGNNKQICLECRRLKAENDLLRLEIERLKRIVSGNNEQSKHEDHGATYCSDFVPVEMILADQSASDVVVTKESTLSQKIALFRSLFQGREDVYALRYEGKRGGKPGYTPACENIWKSGICPKPKIKCQDCNRKDYLLIDDQVIEEHLRGEKVIGVYPILTDDRCWFIAIDFDEGDWQADTRAIHEYCSEKNLPIAVERSRSGNGAHIWFFFSEPLPASKGDVSG